MEKVEQSLWEILVPVYDNDDVEWTLGHHRLWDKEVRNIAGGLTINKRARGIWRSPSTGRVFQEKVIPVRIFCSKADIKTIIDFTLTHYEQEAVMAYLISDTIYVVHKDN